MSIKSISASTGSASRALRLPSLVLLTLLSSFLAYSSCNDPDTTIVSVKLTGSTPDVDAIRVKFSLDGVTDSRSPYTFDKNTTFFGIQLYRPANRGNLSVGVELLQQKCIVSSGQNQIKIDGQSAYDLEVQVVSRTKSCPITVTKYGEGTVTSQQPGINCGAACEAYFDFDKPVRLDAAPGIPGTPFLWGGKCGSSPTCEVTPSAATVVQIDFTPRVCRPSQFCWENPLPLASTLRSVWVSPSQTAFVVGDFGAILRSTPAGWASMDSGSQEGLLGVFGVDDTDVWAVGTKGTALHWTGGKWTATNSGTTQPLRSVWAASATEVWAVGDQGTILRWDGATWAPQASPVQGQIVYLNAVWGSSARDIWAVGDGGTILHYDGSAWKASDGKTTKLLRAVWGTGSGDVWAVGDSSTVRRWNGTDWQTPAAPGAGATRLSGVWGLGVNTVFTVGTEQNGQGQYEGVGYAWNGTGWTKQASLTNPANWFAVSGKGPSKGFIVGSSGAVAQYDGKDWQPSNSQAVKDFRGILVSAMDDGWAVGSGGKIFRWDGLRWMPSPQVTTSDLKAVWGSSRDDVWAVGTQGTVLHYSGSAWAPVMTGTSASFLNSVAGNGPNDVWVAGDEVLRWDGSKWNPMPKPPISLSSLFVEGTTVHAGSSSATYKFEGNAWQQTSSEYVVKIAGRGTDLYAAGFKGVLRWTGTTWNVVYPTLAGGMRDLFYRSSNEIWAVGEEGRVVMWDGTKWSQVDVNVAASLSGVTGFGDRDVWIAGDNGAILRRR